MNVPQMQNPALSSWNAADMPMHFERCQAVEHRCRPSIVLKNIARVVLVLDRAAMPAPDSVAAPFRPIEQRQMHRLALWRDSLDQVIVVSQSALLCAVQTGIFELDAAPSSYAIIFSQYHSAPSNPQFIQQPSSSNS